MKILFVHGGLSSFTRTDLDILCSRHDVRVLHFRRNLRLLASSVIMAMRGALWADLIFSWFGSVHALVPFLIGRSLGRKCVVVAGGYDVDAVPEINYGNMRPGIRRCIGLLVFHLASQVLAFSQSAARSATANAQVPPAKLQVIELGLDSTPPADTYITIGKRQGSITIGNVNQSNLARKGLETFVQTAHYLPEVGFALIGKWSDNAIDHLRSIASSNVEFTGPLSDADSIRRMQTAAVYVQVSAHEGFGMALAEAMLCGCIPVVTDRGSLREVVGDVGFYVPYGDPQTTAEAIRKALGADPEMGQQARQRIIDNFPLEKRHQKLLEIIEEMSERC